MQSLDMQWIARLNTSHNKPKTSPLDIRTGICCLLGEFATYFLIQHQPVMCAYHSPQISLELQRNNDNLFAGCTPFPKGNVRTSEL